MFFPIIHSLMCRGDVTDCIDSQAEALRCGAPEGGADLPANRGWDQTQLVEGLAIVILVKIVTDSSIKFMLYFFFKKKKTLFYVRSFEIFITTFSTPKKRFLGHEISPQRWACWAFFYYVWHQWPTKYTRTSSMRL